MLLDLSQPGRYISLFRGFLVVSESQEEIARIALDQIDSIIVSSTALTFSSQILSALSAENIPLVIIGENYHPVGILLSYLQHSETKDRLSLQIKASQPLLKQLWKQIVIQKIKTQKHLLQLHHMPCDILNNFIKRVGSGDPSNMEAQAARFYWPQLFGKDFRRDPLLPGINAFLNYGYTIIRASLARAVAGYGLHPSMGINHHNEKNNFCLVDDLIEPYRFLIDEKVYFLTKNATNLALSPIMKKELVATLDQPTAFNGKMSDIRTSFSRTALSLVESFRLKKSLLQFPELSSHEENTTATHVPQKTYVDDGDV